MRFLLTAALIALAGTAQAQSFREAVDTRNPIIYNSADDEVGVIQGSTQRGDSQAAVVQLVHGGALDLGYFQVAIPAAALRPRERGGWYTSFNNTELANLEPYTTSGTKPFFWRSGAN